MFVYSIHEKFPYVLFPVAVVLISLAFVSFWDWAVWKVITYKAMLDKPYIPSDEVRILEAIRTMNDNQLSTAFAAMGYEYQAPPEYAPQISDPEVAPDVTKSYAVSKLDRAARNDGYLEPIRTTSQGTADRRRMEALVDHLVRLGLATPAAGNKPARVTDYKKARERILE